MSQIETDFKNSFIAFVGLIMLVVGMAIGIVFSERSLLTNIGLAVLVFGGLGMLTYGSLSGYVDEQDFRKKS